MSGSRRKSVPKKPQGGVFENVEWLIDGSGEITIGAAEPIRCAATAADEHQCLAMLVRRPGESILDWMRRLDAAIASACENDAFIDEINAPPRRTAKRVGKAR